MNRKLLWVVPAVVLCAADAGGQTREPPTTSTVQVTIGTAAPELWKSATVGSETDLIAVRTTTSDGKLVAVNRAGPTRLRGVAMRGVIAGSSASGFDTDLAAGVTRVVFEPTKLDVVLGTVSDRGTLGPNMPGVVHLGKVTFTTAPPARAVADWVKAVSDGRATKRDVTVTIRGTSTRTITLKGCLPAQYVSNGSSAAVTLAPDAMTVGGSSHAAAFEWVNAALSGQAATALRRDVRFVFADGTRELARSQMRYGLLTEIGFSPLDRSTSAPVEESISFLPEQIDVVP